MPASPVTSRPLARLLLVLLLLQPMALAAVLLPAGPAAAATCPQTQNQPHSLTLAPDSTSSVVGTNHTITATVTGRGGPLPDMCVQFGQNAGPSTGWPRTATTGADGTASITWSSAAVGTDSITASTYDGNATLQPRATIRHTWTAKPTPKPTPTPTPSPTPKPTPPPTPTAGPTTPAPSATTNPTPPPTATPSSSASASATPPAATATPSSSSAPSTTPPTPPDSGLTLDRPSTIPGGSAKLSGRDCPPSAPVTITLAGAPVGQTVAAPDGSFSGDVQLPQLPIGDYLLDVACGAKRGSVRIDLVVASAVGSSGVTTAVAILVFFVLIGGILLVKPHREVAGDLQEVDTEE